MNKKYKFPQVKMRMALLVVLGVFVMALALLGVGLGYTAIVRNNTALELARIAPVRDLLLRAIDGIKMDAPIDPKTGDAYFPPTKLYLPGAAAETAGLTYRYEKDLGLSVSSKQTIGRATYSLYNAQSADALFQAVPHAQSCQRGVTVSYEPLNDTSVELQQTIRLNDGKALYLYAEKACPEISDLVALLKGFRTY